jgi:hypothetical protein
VVTNAITNTASTTSPRFDGPDRGLLPSLGMLKRPKPTAIQSSVIQFINKSYLEKFEFQRDAANETHSRISPILRTNSFDT